MNTLAKKQPNKVRQVTIALDKEEINLEMDTEAHRTRLLKVIELCLNKLEELKGLLLSLKEIANE